ncbi:MAG: phosphatidate cytidylyltransferase [Patescibacteria group bacterium]|jgi:phosphatidate cytidylyltransferase
MKTFLARLLVTAIGIPLTITSIFLGDKDFFFVMVLVTVVLMANEFSDMAGEKEYLKWSSIVTAVAAYMVAYASITDGFEQIILCLAGATIIFLGAEVLSKKLWVERDNPLRLILYLGVLSAFLAAIRAIPGDTIVLGFQTGIGSILVLDFLCVVWAMDIFAYLIGRKIESPHLCPEISAGKTIGGSIAGFAVAVIVAALFAFVLHKPSLVIIGPVVGILGQIGDLVESLLKRKFGVKDSGTLFPGHGGMLDRLDSVIYSAPVVYFLFRLIGF